MFEYLMPQLLMRSFPGTLLDQSCRASVRRQIDYGAAAARAVGHLRVGLCLHRSRGHLSVPGVRRARARPQARPRHRPRDRAVRHGAGEPGVTRERRPRTSTGWPRPASRGATGSTKSVDYNPRGRGDDDLADSRRAAGDRARLLLPPPGHVAGGAGQRRLRRRVRRRGSTPIPACRRRSCCCRSGCRARRSSPSRGRPRPPRHRRRCRRSRRAVS